MGNSEADIQTRPCMKNECKDDDERMKEYRSERTQLIIIIVLTSMTPSSNKSETLG